MQNPILCNFKSINLIYQFTIEFLEATFRPTVLTIGKLPTNQSKWILQSGPFDFYVTTGNQNVYFLRASCRISSHHIGPKWIFAKYNYVKLRIYLFHTIGFLFNDQKFCQKHLANTFLWFMNNKTSSFPNKFVY